jgi:hypothetical protein
MNGAGQFARKAPGGGGERDQNRMILALVSVPSATRAIQRAGSGKAKHEESRGRFPDIPQRATWSEPCVFFGAQICGSADGHGLLHPYQMPSPTLIGLSPMLGHRLDDRRPAQAEVIRGGTRLFLFCLSGFDKSLLRFPERLSFGGCIFFPKERSMC